MTEPRVTAAGKQLQLDGQHLADCRDPEAAAVIAICLNKAERGRHGEMSVRVEEFFA